MPRVSREESYTGYYHVMTRGINKEKIFKSKSDKQKLIDIIKEKLNEVD
jgi:REP element-mobilizing transposase RayT